LWFDKLNTNGNIKVKSRGYPVHPELVEGFPRSFARASPALFKGWDGGLILAQMTISLTPIPTFPLEPGGRSFYKKRKSYPFAVYRRKGLPLYEFG
jgi:hypothetical protein